MVKRDIGSEILDGGARGVAVAGTGGQVLDTLATAQKVAEHWAFEWAAAVIATGQAAPDVKAVYDRAQDRLVAAARAEERNAIRKLCDDHVAAAGGCLCVERLDEAIRAREEA